MLTSCATTHIAATSDRDSVKIEVVERVVEIHDTVTIEIPKIEERRVVKEDSSFLQNQYARSQAIIHKDGTLEHYLESIHQELRKPITLTAPTRDSIIYHRRDVVNTVEVERELTRWQVLQINGFWILLALATLSIALRRILQ